MLFEIYNIKTFYSTLSKFPMYNSSVIEAKMNFEKLPQ